MAHRGASRRTLPSTASRGDITEETMHTKEWLEQRASLACLCHELTDAEDGLVVCLPCCESCLLREHRRMVLTEAIERFKSECAGPGETWLGYPTNTYPSPNKVLRVLRGVRDEPQDPVKAAEYRAYDKALKLMEQLSEAGAYRSEVLQRLRELRDGVGT